MPQTTSHPPSGPSIEWLVSQYALGQLPRAASVLTQAYLEMNPSMRPTADHVEQVGGWSLETSRPVPLTSGMTAASLLATLNDADVMDAPARDLAEATGSAPATLLDAIGQPISSLPWKWRGIGAYEHRLTHLEDEGIVARLLRIEPGRAVPQHTHQGLEATLVIAGAYTDDAGHFGPGDLELADDAVDHKPVAERGETCICFAVTEAPMQLTGRVGRLFQSLL